LKAPDMRTHGESRSLGHLGSPTHDRSELDLR
jgi:hypothetical protein